PLLRVDDREPGRGLRRGALQHFPDRDAFPGVVVPAPARDAVDIRVHLHSRQGLELRPRPALRMLHEPVDAQLPLREIDARHRAVVQHRPLLGLDLPRREPGLLTGTLDLLIGRSGFDFHGFLWETSVWAGGRASGGLPARQYRLFYGESSGT